MDDAVAEEYKSSLGDLNCNSKPLINMLTILAEENIKNAPQIVKTITDHVLEVAPEAKLPCLYLIDSIIKNVRKNYLNLFSQNIVAIFASVFEKVDENTRMLLYRLRQTWNEIFSNKILYALDIRVKEVDPAWPVTAQAPPQSIHINPKFLGAAGVQKTPDQQQPVLVQREEAKLKAQQTEVLKQLFAKQEQLRMLEQKKRELATKQFLSSDSANIVDLAVPHIQSRAIDPRIAAKMNPKLSQRDPRLQKVAVASVLKKNVTQSKQGVTDSKKVAQVPPVTSNSDSHGTKVALVPPVPIVSASCDKTDASLVTQGISKPDHSSQQSFPSPSDGKNIQNASADGNSSKKMRSEKEGPLKREQSSSPSNRAASVRKKRKIDDPDSENLEKETSPRKSPKGKGNKKKESPKKSAANTPEQGNDKKQQPRSPLHKIEKKTVNRDEYSLKDKKTENESNDSKHPDKRSKKVEPKDEDVDLRKITKDQEVRNKREIQNEGKENFDEPPGKKHKDVKRKDSDTDSLFGHEDQDYRQLSKNGKHSHLKGWAMYKAAHPDEFKIPRRQFLYSNDMGNQQPRFGDHEKNNSGNKMGPHHFREFYDHGSIEYDRLGRLRLPKLRRNQRFGYPPSFAQREEAFRCVERDPFLDPQFITSVMGDPKDMLRQAEERHRLGRISEKDFNYIRNELERMWASEEYHRFRGFQDFNRAPNLGNIKGMHQMLHTNRENYMNAPKGRIPENIHPPLKENLHQQGYVMPPPAVRTFRLDNKSRTIHFIEDKAIILMDNDEPRELTFRGEPTQVFIEGLEPIMLRFDGRPVEFELDGKIYSMKFGAPSRELYINNHPYEGKFGGPPFDVMLNGRVYRISLGGPPPQVQVSEHPVHELYHKFLSRNRGNPEIKLPSGNNRTHIPPGDILREHSNAMPFDVDMRSEPVPVRNSDDMRDIDWRQGAPPPEVRENQRGYDFPPNGTPPFTDDQSQRMDHVLRKPVQDPNEWNRREDPNFNSFTHDQIPPRQHDWRKYPAPQHDVKMTYSPHHTPPREGHPDEWEHPPVSRPFEQTVQSTYEQPNRSWMSGDFSRDGPRPVHPPVSDAGNMFNIQRNSPQQYEAYPEYHGSEPRTLSKGPIRPPMRPPFNPHMNRPEFNERASMPNRLPRPPIPPWIHNQRQPRPESTRHPVLPPPPRPPMHMRMPESFMRALPPPPLPPPSVTDSVAADAVIPQSSVSVASVPTSSSAVALPPVTTASDIQDGATETTLTTTSPSNLNFDISTLIEKLVAAGIITKSNEDSDSKKPIPEEEEGKETEGKKEKEKDPNEEPVPPIQFNLESLKIRYSGVTSALYRGSQCASCGMRFKEIHGERYSRHLDWHFRVNRREKDGVKKAFSRKWYYEVEDWIQFEEFEDFEERARSFFEMQADEQFQIEPEVEVPSVPVSGQETEACVVCGELFQLFWVEEEEEWHLRNAVRHDAQAYHPSCYEDFKKSLEGSAKDEAIEEGTKDHIATQEVKEEITTDVPEEMLVDVKQELADEGDKIADENCDAAAEVVQMLVDATVKNDDARRLEEEEEEGMKLVVVKEEPKEEEELQGKPGEEEIIGVITEVDNESDSKPADDSEKVVFKSGSIVMKVRAESLKPASPSTENIVGKDPDLKVAAEESDDEEEFRPPTPDPRFQVMPPVQRGTELSGLCCIM